MEEGRVAYHCADLSEPFLAEGLACAKRLTDAGTHADAAVERLERWCCPQRITTDVTENKGTQLLQRIEEGSVRTTGAHVRGPSGKVFRFDPDLGCLVGLPF